MYVWLVAVLLDKALKSFLALSVVTTLNCIITSDTAEAFKLACRTAVAIAFHLIFASLA